MKKKNLKKYKTFYKKILSSMFSKCFYYVKRSLLECKHSINIVIKFTVFSISNESMCSRYQHFHLSFEEQIKILKEQCQRWSYNKAHIFGLLYQFSVQMTHQVQFRSFNMTMDVREGISLQLWWRMCVRWNSITVSKFLFSTICLKPLKRQWENEIVFLLCFPQPCRNQLASSNQEYTAVGPIKYLSLESMVQE